MVVIDAHCHLSRFGGSKPASILLDGMNGAGIDMSVVFGDNKFVSESANKYPDRLIPFFYFNPKYEEVLLPELERHARSCGGRG